MALRVGPVFGQRHGIEVNLALERDRAGSLSNPDRAADGRQPAHGPLQQPRVEFADRQLRVRQPGDIVDQFVDFLPIGLGGAKFVR